jgi:hypothetical protein
MEKWKWNWGEQLAGRTIVGGITGGIAAEMYGGKFMDGFVMGAESAAFGMVCNEVVSLGLSVNWGGVFGSMKGFGLTVANDPTTGKWELGGYVTGGGGAYGGASASADVDVTVSDNTQIDAHAGFSKSVGGSATILGAPSPATIGAEIGYTQNHPVSGNFLPSRTFSGGFSVGTVTEAHGFLTYTHVWKWATW